MPDMQWIEPKKLTKKRLSAYGDSLSPLIATLLINRGVRPEDADSFLHPLNDRYQDPFLLPDMQKAVDRIVRALRDGEGICIFGDYDADGLTSQAILNTALKGWGFDNAMMYTPHRRSEGYGLNKQSIGELSKEGIAVIVAIDLGTSNRDEVEEAAAYGIDVCVFDHHHIGNVLPGAYAFVNPHLPDCRYSFREFSGAGLAFQLVRALSTVLGQPDDRTISTVRALAAIGTVADIVPMSGENRMLVVSGLNALHNSGHIGLRALSRFTGTPLHKVDTMGIGFGIGPRINAMGRMYNPEIVRGILLPTTGDQAHFSAMLMERANRERQKLTGTMMAQAIEMIDGWDALPPVIFVGKEGWPSGLVGLIAGKIADRYHRPVFAYRSNGSFHSGSARAFGSYDVIDAMERSSKHLLRFGGHTAAAGFSTDSIEAFRESILEQASSLSADSFRPFVSIDADINHDNLSLATHTEIQTLSPFGVGNREPVFRFRLVRIVESKIVGKDKSHLSMKLLLDDERIVSAIAFGQADRRWTISAEREYDVVGHLQINSYNGEDTLTIQAIDFRPSDWLDG